MIPGLLSRTPADRVGAPPLHPTEAVHLSARLPPPPPSPPAFHDTRHREESGRFHLPTLVTSGTEAITGPSGHPCHPTVAGGISTAVHSPSVSSARPQAPSSPAHQDRGCDTQSRVRDGSCFSSCLPCHPQGLPESRAQTVLAIKEPVSRAPLLKNQARAGAPVCVPLASAQ